MEKQVTFSVRIDSALRDQFIQTAKDSDRTASQLIRDSMREIIKQKHDEQAYREFVNRKVAKALASVNSDPGIPHEQMKFRFGEMRRTAAKKLCGI